MDRANGKVAIVTGAASVTGIGRRISAVLAAEGATVLMTDVDVEGGEKAAAEVGHGAIFLEHDVRVEECWQRVMETAVSRFGRLDILVNNAGITGAEAREDMETISLDAWRAVQSVNVEGVALGCKWAIKTMKARNSGSIVNISSMAALIATATLPAYGASKAAVRQITQTVAQHCGRQGYRIRCNSIHPGIIDTELVGGAFSEEQLANLKRSIPSGEFGVPDDVAQAVLFLASDESRYVTGTRLIVDGGATMQ
jgi:NAD(P)-dependent dehydrogenase (short-subunit alcohol dehydrogenase family)